MMPNPTPPRFSPVPPAWLYDLPKKDPWSTPFAESLLAHLDLQPGLTVLDVCCGDGIPAFYLAHRVGFNGRVVGFDLNHAQLIRSRAVQGLYFPWLEFRHGDVRALPSDLGRFDRITGNLSFMFFRPHRQEALHQLIGFLKPGGQVVLTFPSLGTFDSLWKRVEQEMKAQNLTTERERFSEYLAERPSAQDAKNWLVDCGLEKVEVVDDPLEVQTNPGHEFLYHPLLRGGFLDDVYECFTDQELADRFMNTIANDIPSFVPLFANRCVMAGWLPKK
ncbi:MAG: class I SAM-dependent methyltransferase [Nitrospirales bacterium]